MGTDMMELAQQLTIQIQDNLKTIHKLKASIPRHTIHHHLITTHPLTIEILTVNLPLGKVDHRLRTTLTAAIPLPTDPLR